MKTYKILAFIILFFLILIGLFLIYLALNQKSETPTDEDVSFEEACGNMWFSMSSCPYEGAARCDGYNSLGQRKLHICYPNGYVNKDSEGNYHLCGTGWLDTTVACYCGDNYCLDGESTANCPQDCGSNCGDGACNGTETAASCAQDCASCGDGICSQSETSFSCPQDCASCGDGTCNNSETPTTCPQDCGTCGNLICDSTETVVICPSDCVNNLPVTSVSEYSKYSRLFLGISLILLGVILFRIGFVFRFFSIQMLGFIEQIAISKLIIPENKVKKKNKFRNSRNFFEKRFR